MNIHNKKQYLGVLFTLISLVLATGCSSPLPTKVSINSPISGAYVLTKSGNMVERCPLSFEIEWKYNWDLSSNWRCRSDCLEMIEYEYSDGCPIFYLVGAVGADGYQTRNFRRRIGSGSVGNRDEYVSMNVMLSPVYEPRPRQQASSQQQQQQQQTVVIPGMGTGQQAESGNVMISSRPENCDVYVDGVFVGNTPANLNLKAGIHIIEVKKTGYSSYRREIRVFGKSETPLNVNLEAVPK